MPEGVVDGGSIVFWKRPMTELGFRGPGICPM